MLQAFFDLFCPETPQEKERREYKEKWSRFFKAQGFEVCEIYDRAIKSWMTHEGKVGMWRSLDSFYPYGPLRPGTREESA